MSGGHYNYIQNKEPSELFNEVSEIEDMSEDALRFGYEDISKDLRRLTEYIKSSLIRVEVLSEQLHEVMKGLDYYQSCDIGKSSLDEIIEKYRKGGKT